MEFSILMGADQIERLDGWKEYDRIPVSYTHLALPTIA